VAAVARTSGDAIAPPAPERSETRSSSRRLLHVAALAGVALAIAALRAPGIGERSLWLDEALTASRALRTPSAIVAGAASNQNPPLYTLLVAGWASLFGVSEVSLRLPSLLASAAAAALLVLLVWRRLGGEAAIYAALLLAASEPQLYYAREARSYAVLGLLCVASFLVYLELLERPTWPRAMALGLLNAAAMYTHFAIGFAFVAQAAYALLDLRRGARAVAFYALSQLLALAIFLPWVDALRANAPEAGQFWLAPPGLPALRSVVFDLAGGRWAIALSLLVVACAGWTLLSRGRRIPAARARTLAVLAAWAIAPVALGFLVSQWTPVFLLRYQLYAGLGWIALVAALAASLPLPRALRAGAVAAIALAAASHLDWGRVRGADWRSASELAVGAASSDAAIVVAPSYACLPFAYYADPEAFADAERTLERLASRRVFCVEASDAVDGARLGWPQRVIALVGNDAGERLPAWLEVLERDGYQPAGDGDVGGVRYGVLRRIARPRPAAIAVEDP
jgi:mannosyltransferase